MRGVLRLDHAQRLKRHLVHHMRARHGCGVRGGGLRALFAAAALQQNQRLTRVAHFQTGAGKRRTVAQTFDVAQHRGRVGIVGQVVEVLRKLHAGFVSRVDEVTELEPTRTPRRE